MLEAESCTCRMSHVCPWSAFKTIIIHPEDRPLFYGLPGSCLILRYNFCCWGQSVWCHLECALPWTGRQWCLSVEVSLRVSGVCLKVGLCVLSSLSAYFQFQMMHGCTLGCSTLPCITMLKFIWGLTAVHCKVAAIFTTVQSKIFILQIYVGGFYVLRFLGFPVLQISSGSFAFLFELSAGMLYLPLVLCVSPLCQVLFA